MIKTHFTDGYGISLEVVPENDGAQPAVTVEVSDGNYWLCPTLTTREDLESVIGWLKEAGKTTGLLGNPDGVWASIRAEFSSKFPLKAGYLEQIRLVWHSGSRLVLTLPDDGPMLAAAISGPAFIRALVAVANQILEDESDLIFLTPPGQPLICARHLVSPGSSAQS